MVEDKNSMVIGADGSVMHSLHAGKGCTVTIRLLKTSPVNYQLMSLFNYQTTSSANHGQNTISIRNPVRGDSITVSQAAFKKQPDLSYAKDGNTVEWGFDGVSDTILGIGTPAI